MADPARAVVAQSAVGGIRLGGVLSVDVNRRTDTNADKNGKPPFEVYTVRVSGAVRKVGG